MKKIFNTDKRINLGLWGLGRGTESLRSMQDLNFDLVAGCDYNEDLRNSFKEAIPDAFVTDNVDEFLAQDMDAVLIATFLFDHTKHTIMALEKGLHVMCEVTAFTTPAEGVQLVEAVEKSGKIYNFLENYPFTKKNMYLRKLWQEGFFGEFQYGEFEYLHEERVLQYCYNAPGGPAIEPGWTCHSWRGKIKAHTYITHSLGPVMNITGLRPVQVSAPTCEVGLTGTMLYSKDAVGSTVAPSFFKMSNGGIYRNCQGSTTNNYHMGARIWGTRAGAEHLYDDTFKIRVGAFGDGLLLDVDPEWPDLAEEAEAAGHSGGDFWQLYFFAREVLFGEKAPWDIYGAADLTMAGICACRSMELGGIPVDIPDFRNKEDRDKYRDDHYSVVDSNRDPQNIFPEGHDTNITKNFNTLMTKIYPLYCGEHGIKLYYRAVDGIKLYDNIVDPAQKLTVVNAVNKLIKHLPELAKNCSELKKIGDLYPECPAGWMIAKFIRENEMDKIFNYEETIKELQDWLSSL